MYPIYAHHNFLNLLQSCPAATYVPMLINPALYLQPSIPSDIVANLFYTLSNVTT